MPDRRSRRWDLAAPSGERAHCSLAAASACQRAALALALAALVGDVADVTSQQAYFKFTLISVMIDGSSGAGDSELVKVLLVRLVRSGWSGCGFGFGFWLCLSLALSC